MTPTSRNPVHYDRIGGLDLTVWATKKKTSIKKLPQVHGEISRQGTAWLMGDQSLAIDLYGHGKHDEEATTNNKGTEKPPKPEPIFVTGVLDINALRNKLKEITTTDDYT
ncbi:hypothetical protein EVAR_87888_1 [Eumeta japonica]|uniref:Uncharacterized protein n=1 Tax=Eumeta variegata TaxID=151549 RepID=A0A4C1WXR7_EUMVA|nr:hypothetical protein EVAR_87888_1 [Eumeta japonica]